MAILGIFYIALQVADLARSKRFYAEQLGWQLHTDEPAVAGLHFGTGYVVLLSEPGVETRLRPGGTCVAVKVQGIEAEHARLKALGVPVSDLVAQHWGEKNFTFKDPDGYEWSYGEASAGS